MSDKKLVKNFNNSDNEDTIVFTSPSAQNKPVPQPQYRAPQQNPYPQQQYGAPQQNPYPQQQPQYGAPQQNPYPQQQPQYGAPQQNPYPQQQPQYGAPQQNPYPQQQPQYGAPQQNPYPQQQQYGAPQQNPYPQQPQYSAPQQNPYPQQPQYGAPQQNPYPQQTPPKQHKEKKRKKKHHKSLLRKIITRIIVSLLILCLLLFGIYSCTSVVIIRKMDHVSDGERHHTRGAMSEKHVKNVLIIGTDGRTEDDNGRSDTMILLSFNSKTNELTMTSFLRDSYVEVRGHGKEKLNAAYAYGGPELLMDTIESNFNVRIDDYIAINFSTFASLIDSAGGVDIELSDDEAEAVNVILRSEVNELMGDSRDDGLLSSGGKLHLNGKQALSYSRIRSVGKWDFERTSRQRKVITELIKKARSNGISFVIRMTRSALPDVTTNMDTSNLYLLSLRMPFVIRYDIKQLQIPADGTYTNTTGTPSGDVLELDFDKNTALIRDNIYQ